MDTFLVLLFFILVIFFGLFYGSRKAMVVTLISLGVTEIYVVVKIAVSPGSFIIPGTILSVFIIGYFIFIFSLIKHYQKKDDDQYGLFQEYYRDAVKKYEMLEKEDGLLREGNKRLDGELDESVSFYENIKNITSMLDFPRKLELMAGFIRSLAEFAEGKLILIETAEGRNRVEKVFNISSAGGSASKVIYETDAREQADLYGKLMGEFERGFSALFSEQSVKSDYRSLAKKDFRTIGAIPLSSENDLMGIVLVFDVERRGFEKIQALGPLLAMELKKIKLYEKVKELSIVDGLTGLYLRRHFNDILLTEIDRAQRTKQPLSFLIADVDYFKNINDNYGHLVGDILLREVAGIIRNEARSVDLIGRYGGDEIAMALPRADLNTATQVAERMRSAVKAHTLNLGDDEMKVSLSIGISSYPLNCGTIEEMIERADRALYKAKEEGRDRVVVYGG
jgi:diguanylate cyclase (GGDEF)-like protein